jgi:hypothetical protein
MNMPYYPSIHLYRALVRAARALPFAYLRKKTLYNIRDAFELYKYERDAKLVDELIEMGWKDVEILLAWKHMDNETMSMVFRRSALSKQS